VDDAEYFAARECEERALAKAAPNAQVRDIHLALAEKYVALAARERGSAGDENEVPAQA
jgi:hypothetical protein